MVRRYSLPSRSLRRGTPPSCPHSKGVQHGKVAGSVQLKRGSLVACAPLSRRYHNELSRRRVLALAESLPLNKQNWIICAGALRLAAWLATAAISSCREDAKASDAGEPSAAIFLRGLVGSQELVELPKPEMPVDMYQSSPDSIQKSAPPPGSTNNKTTSVNPGEFLPGPPHGP